MDAQPPRNCEECGADIRPWDFVGGRAVLVQNTAFCVGCRPANQPVTPIPEARGETKWRRQRNKQVL